MDALTGAPEAIRRWIKSAPYIRKWGLLGVLIGIVAGAGAVVFYTALKLATKLMLQDIAGYRPPEAAGDGHFLGGGTIPHPLLLVLVVAGGGLISGLIVFTFAPDAAGHGTDAAIDAVHHSPRGISAKTVVVKIIASAITIGSGGSAGREGPTGQISAGFGSLLARQFDLSEQDAKIAVATGIGSGIGSIFGAPLGGAVLAAEVLYRDDIDPSALLPSFVASGVGYAIFGSVEGFTPLFGFDESYRFTQPSHLIWFAVIGLLGGLIGLLYATGFYGLHDWFSNRSPLPKWLNPALGGLLVGLIALAVPETLGTGYGWIQKALGPELRSIPLWIVVALPFVRIIATGLSIGSGGSGGVFAPGLVIGAFIGAAVWRVVYPVTHVIGADPAPYVIVGMMCCFGSIARAPLALMLMVVEMTGSFSVIEPGILAVGIAWLIVQAADDSMYRSQLPHRSISESARQPGDVYL